VDTLLRAVDGCCDARDRDGIVRAGVTVDSTLLHLTTAGYFRRRDPERIARLERLGDEIESLEEALSKHYTANLAKRLVDARPERRRIREELRQHEASLLEAAPCVAATLSKLVLARPLRERRFDAVIVDEASMVNLPYVLSAACVPVHSLCYGGDPMLQLPPICQSEKATARRWLGRNATRSRRNAVTSSSSRHPDRDAGATRR